MRTYRIIRLNKLLSVYYNYHTNETTYFHLDLAHPAFAKLIPVLDLMGTVRRPGWGDVYELGEDEFKAITEGHDAG